MKIYRKGIEIPIVITAFMFIFVTAVSICGEVPHCVEKSKVVEIIRSYPRASKLRLANGDVVDCNQCSVTPGKTEICVKYEGENKLFGKCTIKP